MGRIFLQEILIDPMNMIYINRKKEIINKNHERKSSSFQLVGICTDV